jgi:hypothetical protein
VVQAGQGQGNPRKRVRCALDIIPALTLTLHRFIPDINKVAKVKEISPTQNIWTLYYTFSPPISPRVFTVVQITRLNESSPRSGCVNTNSNLRLGIESFSSTIVSIPVDLTEDEALAKLEEKGVKGRYVSVERLLELEDGSIEWRMATSSTPGGLHTKALSALHINTKL